MSKARNVFASILVLAGFGLMTLNCGGGGCSAKKEPPPPPTSTP